MIDQNYSTMCINKGGHRDVFLILNEQHKVPRILSEPRARSKVRDEVCSLS